MNAAPGALYEAIRRESSREVWSRGVNLARADAAVVESRSPEEVVLRIRAAGERITPTVVLYPPEAEWECDCGGADDPCAHVAAAAIALHRARSEGRELAEAGQRMARLRYAFRRDPAGLHFERLAVLGDEATPFRATLAALASGRVEGPALAATPADQEVELILGAQRQGRLPRGVLSRLLGVLPRCPDVRLDDAPVRTSGEPVGFRARLVDADPGFRLLLEREPPITELLGDGFALCGDEIRELGSSGLSGRELEELGRGRRFAPDEVLELVTEVLPSLGRRLPVEIATQRLPDTLRVAPRVVIEVSREQDSLVVLPRLVYGDPPCARVDAAGNLVPLQGPVPLRDLDAEARLRRELGAALDLAPGLRQSFADREALALAEGLERWGGELRGDAHRAFRPAAELLPQLSAAEDDFALDFVSPGTEGRAEGRAGAAQVMRAWREGRELVPLLGGGLAPLPAAWLARHGQRVADLLAAREASGRLPTALLPDLARLCEAEGLAPPAGLARLAALLGKGDELPALRLPDDLEAELRGYQAEGVRWLGALADAGLGALLADDMGLGKTLQALCSLRGRSLVVAPTSVLPNWEAEARRFRPALRVCVYHGARRRLEREADLVLTSYALLRQDREQLASEAFDSVVLDEAQLIKNPDSQVARAAFDLRADFRIALTGTPVENRLEELWSQMRFLNPGLLGGRSDFAERYARPIAAGDAAAAARLRERLAPFLLRRLKSEVARELPPRQETVLRVALEEEERALYDAVRAATLPEVVTRLREGGSVMAALEALLRLRQACCHPALLPGPAASTTSSKLALLVQRLETALADGHCALVFSQWTRLLDLCEPLLRAAGIDFTRLDGSTRDRGAVLRSFESPEGPPVLLISLKAGGTGLNLSRADHVFLLDPWWNPATEDQAADRAHRIGQTRPVLIHRLVAVDTVEERILALQERKRALAEAALGGAAGSLPGRDELLALLE